MLVIFIIIEFLLVLGLNEKLVSIGFFSFLGIRKKCLLFGRVDCFFFFNCDWWFRNYSY